MQIVAYWAWNKTAIIIGRSLKFVFLKRVRNIDIFRTANKVVMFIMSG